MPAVNVVDLRTERSLWRLVRLLVVHPSGFTALLWNGLSTGDLFARPCLTVSRILQEMFAVLGLVRYLRRSRPSVIFAAGDRANLLALCARRIAGADTKVVISQHSLASAQLNMRAERVGIRRACRVMRMMGRAFLRADAIVSVSEAAANELSCVCGIPRKRITVIYNPVVNSELLTLAKAPLHDPLFRQGAPPVILGAGQLVDGKDFPTLLRAFAEIRRQRPARLVILGEGERRGELESLAAKLAVADDLALPGYVSNPYAYMSRASVFVLSSRHESLSMVLIEALACGCPVVSTDCGGPSEVLGGRVDALVPVGDDAALAAAIITMLDNPPPRRELVERGMWFTVERAVERYAEFVPTVASHVNSVTAQVV